jgi:Fur family transcriptional regulator, ferric uptake regulator
MADHNHRDTKQRKIIYEELQKSKKHPTALEIFDAVREIIPNISLGTVYRNLDVLHELGLIQKIYSGDSQMHYDAYMINHYHVRCLRCGKVRDIKVEPSIKYEHDENLCDDFETMGHNIEFIGICSDCKKLINDN